MQTGSTSSTDEALAREKQRELRRLFSGYRVSRAIYVVAKLGIVDFLVDGPRESTELATLSGANPDALYRLLRFLAGVGLFDEVDQRRFALTPLGAVLGAFRAAAVTLGDPAEWRAWEQLLYSVQTGEPAFDFVHGMSYFDYMAANPEVGASFNAQMAANVAVAGREITHAYDFAGIHRLVDVGGGHGLLLATILQAYPAMHGVLFDLPQVVAGSSATLDAAAVADRCEVVGGDFFAAVTPGGDAYILRQIIHDWDDAAAVVILTNCRQAMADSGRLLVVERRLDPDNRRALPELHLDMEMLIMGGHQRTDTEYRALFAAAGFDLTRVVPLSDPLSYSLYEGLPA